MMSGVPVLGGRVDRGVCHKIFELSWSDQSVVRPPLRAGGDAIAGAWPARRAGSGRQEFDHWAGLRRSGVALATKTSPKFLRGGRFRLRVMGIL